MIIENPYIEEKRRLLIALEIEKNALLKAELNDKLKEAEKNSREFIQDKLNLLQNRTVEVELEMEDVKDLPTKKAQYKEAIKLYRRIMGVVRDGELIEPGLVHELRDLKKSLRCEG